MCEEEEEEDVVEDEFELDEDERNLGVKKDDKADMSPLLIPGNC